MATLPLLTREKIAGFMRTPEQQRAYEALQTALADAQDALTALEVAVAAAQAAADAAQSTADGAVTDAAAAQANIDAHELLTAAHGATGAIVGTTNTQTLSNKTLSGSTPFASQTVGTGAAAPVLTANKPGATTAIDTWWTVRVNGTDYVVPLYLPT